MREYVNKPMEVLAAELPAGLQRLRKGYIDAGEALIQILDPKRAYPYEFVVYRLTGYRPPADNTSEPMPGDSLQGDLARLILDICESLDLSADDYSERVYDIASLARRFNVSTKTIRRMVDRGEIPSPKRVGSLLRWPPSAYEQWRDAK